MVAIIFEFEWVYYLTTLPVDKVIQRRRLKNGAVRGVGEMLQTGVRSRSTQKNSAPLLNALVPVFLRGGPTSIRARLFVYTTTHCSLKAYCAILVRCSNFRHQASPRVSPRESTQRQKVELWAKNVW